MNALPSSPGDGAVEHKKVQTGEFTITDWLQALHPVRLTPSAWRLATQGGRGWDRVEARIRFLDSHGTSVLEIERQLNHYRRSADDGNTYVTEVQGRDFTHGQIFLQNDYALVSSGGSPDVFDLKSQGDGTLAEGASTFVEAAAALATQPGCRIEVRDALGETHVVPASERGWDFDQAQYDIRRINRELFPENGVAAIGRLATAQIPELPPA